MSEVKLVESLCLEDAIRVPGTDRWERIVRVQEVEHGRVLVERESGEEGRWIRGQEVEVAQFPELV